MGNVVIIDGKKMIEVKRPNGQVEYRVWQPKRADALIRLFEKETGQSFFDFVDEEE